jgi:hypothetical protein
MNFVYFVYRFHKLIDIDLIFYFLFKTLKGFNTNRKNIIKGIVTIKGLNNYFKMGKVYYNLAN